MKLDWKKTFMIRYMNKLPSLGQGGAGVNMPALITDFDRFMEILFDAWKNVQV